LKKITKTKFSIDQLSQWFKEITLGIEYLHSKNVIHRDIKPSNILLKNNQIKLSDLGLAKHLEKENVKTWSGTPIYMSPEMLKFRLNNKINVTLQTDVWSIGIVIYELITLKRPFKNEEEIQALNQSEIKDDSIPDLFKELINKMLVKNPDKRINSFELKKKMINWVIKIYSNGRYEGDWLNGKANGVGVYYFLNDDKYDGNWLDGKMNGIGIYHYANGNKFSGYWLNNKRHGHGIVENLKGEKFVGTWKNNLKHGKGIFYFAKDINNNVEYVIQNWKNGKIIKKTKKSKAK